MKRENSSILFSEGIRREKESGTQKHEKGETASEAVSPGKRNIYIRIRQKSGVSGLQHRAESDSGFFAVVQDFSISPRPTAAFPPWQVITAPHTS